jgi:prevent-host-death family protein
MKKVGIFEGKAHFSALIHAAKNGETIIVTKNGEAVAQIGPVKSEKASNKAKGAMKRILSSKVKFGKVTVRELIDEGRRY